MKDGIAIGLLKLVILVLWRFELGLRRALRRLRERPAWRLEGSCKGCGRCCEQPSVRVGPLLWRFEPARRAFVELEQSVNGLELVDEEPESRTLVFRCSHFDPRTRRCDSYRTRPGMCRDYPRILLDQAWPELFPECGFHVRSARAGRLSEKIESMELTEEQRERLRRGLRLD